MNIQYDKVADAIYMKVSQGTVAKTVEISDYLIVDLDKEGNTLGLEILDVSSRADLAETLEKNVLQGLPIGISENTPSLA